MGGDVILLNMFVILKSKHIIKSKSKHIIKGTVAQIEKKLGKLRCESVPSENPNIKKQN